MDKFYYKDGTASNEYIWIDKILHRIDGPAVIFLNTSLYYIDGKEIEEHKFNKYKELIGIIFK
jgi:hypothetical protein